MTTTLEPRKLTAIRPGRWWTNRAEWPQLPGPFKDVAHVVCANKTLGYHFFDRSTLRFFSSRVVPELYAGAIFITSEQDKVSGAPRAWTVRIAAKGGKIHGVGPFQAFGSLRAARKCARKLARLAGCPEEPTR